MATREARIISVSIDRPADEVYAYAADPLNLGVGVLDHVVILADGTEVDVPIRVVANGNGADIVVVHFRLPGMSDAELDRDEAWVRRDLSALKVIVESRS